MGILASKLVKNSLSNSPEFDSACDSTFSHCLTLTQHAFPGVLPYQLSTASEHLYGLLTGYALINRWVHAPPDRSQVDSALRVVTRRSSKSGDEALGPVLFKEWALELYTDAVLSSAGKRSSCGFLLESLGSPESVPPLAPAAGWLGLLSGPTRLALRSLFFLLYLRNK